MDDIRNLSLKELKKEMYYNIGELLLEAIHQENNYIDIDEYLKEKKSFTINDLEE